MSAILVHLIYQLIHIVYQLNYFQFLLLVQVYNNPSQVLLQMRMVAVKKMSILGWYIHFWYKLLLHVARIPFGLKKFGPKIFVINVELVELDHIKRVGGCFSNRWQELVMKANMRFVHFWYKEVYLLIMTMSALHGFATFKVILNHDNY